MDMSKFNNEHDEYVWQKSLDGIYDESGGDDASPTGWFAAITLDPTDEQEHITHYGTPYLLLSESNAGFVTVLPFEKQSERDRRLLDLQQAYGQWFEGIDDQSMREAIDNYLTSAIFTGKYDAAQTWAPAAQVQARDDVTRFILENVEFIRSWMKNTGHNWVQVGIDFWLTRNRHGAGFWSRDKAGEDGDRLTAAAHEWRELVVFIDENKEAVFS
jgi:hypothetical protein